MKKWILFACAGLWMGTTFAKDVTTTASVNWEAEITKGDDPALMVSTDDDSLAFNYVYSYGEFEKTKPKQFTIALKGVADGRDYAINAKINTAKSKLIDTSNDYVLWVGASINKLKLTDTFQPIFDKGKKISIIPPVAGADPNGYQTSTSSILFNIDKITRVSEPTKTFDAIKLPIGSWSGDIEVQIQATWN